MTPNIKKPEGVKSYLKSAYVDEKKKLESRNSECSSIKSGGVRQQEKKVTPFTSPTPVAAIVTNNDTKPVVETKVKEPELNRKASTDSQINQIRETYQSYIQNTAIDTSKYEQYKTFQNRNYQSMNVNNTNQSMNVNNTNQNMNRNNSMPQSVPPPPISQQNNIVPPPVQPPRTNTNIQQVNNSSSIIDPAVEDDKSKSAELSRKLHNISDADKVKFLSKEEIIQENMRRQRMALYNIKTVFHKQNPNFETKNMLELCKKYVRMKANNQINDTSYTRKMTEMAMRYINLSQIHLSDNFDKNLIQSKFFMVDEPQQTQSNLNVNNNINPPPQPPQQ